MINAEICGLKLKFETSDKVFSPNQLDKGTLAMISVVKVNKDDKVLDLGCGYGLAGILFSKLIGTENIFMLDINADAVRLSELNAEINGVKGIKIVQSDGFRELKENNFSIILSNPPYHVDFSVPKIFIEKGFNRLAVGGKMYMVTKREKWYRNKLNSIFGGVKVWNIDGYFVFMAEKRKSEYANKK